MPTQPLRLERIFPADPARVFRAWTDPADLRQWACGTRGNAVAATVDLRPGGAFQVSTVRPDGVPWSFSGNYLEVMPGRTLAHTLRWEAPIGYPPADELISVEFRDCPAGTRVVFVHVGVPDEGAREEHARGWRDTFDLLEAMLLRERAGRELVADPA